MTVLTKGMFTELSVTAQHRIAELQKHILIQERDFRPTWPDANRLIQGIAEDITGALQNQALPVNLEEVAHCLKVNVKGHPRSESSSLGKLSPVTGGFELALFGQVTASSQGGHHLPLFDELKGGREQDQTDLLRSLDSQGRFTVAHELGHTFFFVSDRSSSMSRRLIPKSHSMRRGRWREEGLCHDFARALLMPGKYKSAIAETESMSSLLDATKVFNVSKEPAVRRILYDWGRWPSCLFVNVDFSRTPPRIACFRGKSRKQSSDLSPSRTHIAKWTDGMHTPQEVGAMFRRRFSLSEDRIISNKVSLWVAL